MSCQKKRNLSKEDKNAVVGGMLYLVATPIGNLSDISERALKVLEEVDFIAAEDTRNSGSMLAHFGISKPMISYFEHNKRERGEAIAARLEAGESCALITDAGTPAISDPGEDLVRLCAERGIPVTSIPGCCAAVTALTLSGLNTSRFCFEGFVSTAKSERHDRLTELSTEVRTMIFYEAPHRLRTTLDGAIKIYEEKDPRGEYVIIMAGAEKSASAAEYPEDPAEHVAQLMESGMGRMDAIKAAAKARGVSKNEIYSAVAVKDED